MPKTARFPSLGVNGFLTLLLIALVAACPAVADDYSDGTAAYAARDYKGAATFWHKAALAGSAEAKLQLGLLSDLGLGMPRDPAMAFGWYLQAAQQGLPEAAFNTAVMLDSGTGVVRYSRAASIWYARAALAGYKRAAFNLGLLYRDGSGVPMNDQLAAYWLGAAADTLPAAKQALNRLNITPGTTVTAPLPLIPEIQNGQPANDPAWTNQAATDLVWTAGPGPATSRFAVQIVSDGATGPTVQMLETAASALRVPLPRGGLIWRVARVDPVQDVYEASPWQRVNAATTPDPKGLVSIVVDIGDERAIAAAGNLAHALGSSGLIITVSTSAQPLGSSRVDYRYGADASLARDLAGFLPGFTAGMVTRMPDLQTGPGEVVVHLVLTPPTVSP